MDFVKLKTRYYRDIGILRAGEPAEVLFTRSMAWSGEQESDGFIPSEALPTIITRRAKARAAALVEQGLWEVVDGGWQIVGYPKHQITKERLDAKREAGRERVARHRRNQSGNAVTNGERSSTEVRGKREEVRTAAAAAVPPPLPPAVEILRVALAAAKLEARWDRLTADQLAEVEALVDTHGDAALVKAALVAHRPDRPAAYAQAWLGAWRNLTPPGQLRLVKEEPCPIHAQGTTKHCIGCIADAKAAN